MVQTKSKPRVQRQRLQVQRIFRVKLNAFQSRPDTPYFWLQLEGPRENMGKAKVNSFSPPPPISSSQMPLSPSPGEMVARRGTTALPPPGFSSVAGRYWAILLPHQISLRSFLARSFPLVPSFPAPPLPYVSPLSLKCTESASPVCVPPHEPSLAKAPASAAPLFHLGSNSKRCIAVASATHLFVLHQDSGRPRQWQWAGVPSGDWVLELWDRVWLADIWLGRQMESELSLLHTNCEQYPEID
ncbi:hypothetical protein P7K49_017893 [Saguinus oedipus]|uniref:N4BP1 first type I KH-domain domain-containing protein n=1 Tax=Saguinus oedipus TaxID=9490 RepID=A0ABQ9V477_SAGOE|nr:hypothetical protein P7K49_017893 [Saguinus oedipus]